MVFTSHIFIFYYLPLILLMYYALPNRWRNLFLTFASYLFYGWWKPWFVTLMMASTVVDFFAAKAISAEGASAKQRKLALLISICVNLGLLAVFKYAMFAQENISLILQVFGHSGFQILTITLPVGISFYTFQTMSYSIDVYQGSAKPVRRFNDFSCFVALFPQLIAGPIVRYNTIAEQLAEREHRLDRFASGVSIFILGFSKKILLANPMGDIAKATFETNGLNFTSAWIGVLAYAFQIYFDFSGYSDMAIGLGRMLGFEFPKNFDSPYHSQSITEFWRRWHISLSSWLRDYLYLPLGGNRGSEKRTYFNLAMVMLLGGFWHGAQWQFIFWGLFHGSILAFERMNGKRPIYHHLPSALKMGLTFILVCFSWVLFNANNLSHALTIMRAMIGLNHPPHASLLLQGELFTIYHIQLMVICFLIVRMKMQSWDFVEKFNAWRIALVLALFILSLAAMFTQAFNPFLYFQF